MIWIHGTFCCCPLMEIKALLTCRFGHRLDLGVFLGQWKFVSNLYSSQVQGLDGLACFGLDFSQVEHRRLGTGLVKLFSTEWSPICQLNLTQFPWCLHMQNSAVDRTGPAMTRLSVDQRHIIGAGVTESREGEVTMDSRKSRSQPAYQLQ